MAEFSARSLQLMQQVAAVSENPVRIKQTGYDFVSLRGDGDLFHAAEHEDTREPASLIRYTDPSQLAAEFPYLSPATRQVVRIARAGSMDVHALGSAMLASARSLGVRLVNAEVRKVERDTRGFYLPLSNDAGPVTARELVLCAGPMTPPLAAQLGVTLDIQSFLQRKFVMPDPLGAIPRHMPFTIFADPQQLDWYDEERTLIAQDPDYQWLLEPFPPGLHIKPEPGGHIKLGWAFNRNASEPAWETADDFDFPNITLRGAARMIPGLRPYVDQPPTPLVQYSGYYSRTPENWPVIGPLPQHEGLYTIAALSGYGTMTACAAGELLAAWMNESNLPSYARHFHPDRRDDPEILAEIESSTNDGQL